MGYTTPKVYKPKELAAPEALNRDIADNFDALLSPAHEEAKFQNASGGTNSIDLKSLTWATVSEFDINIDTTGQALFLNFCANLGISTGQYVRFRFLVDGEVTVPYAHGNANAGNGASADVYTPFSMTHFVEGLEAGNHDIEIQANTTSASGTVIIYEYGRLIARELS